MKLYLASKHVQHPKELRDLFSEDASKVNLLLSTNAFDNYPEDRREYHIGNLTSSLKEAGFKPKALDLREYFGQTDSLLELINASDFLWLSGGNVFYLRYVLCESGLDKHLKELVEQGLVYGGDSAGAAILGGDMHGLDLLDNPDEPPETIYDGLGITPFIVLPHWGDERYADAIAETKIELEKHNDEIVTIGDHQVCIVNDDSKHILG